MIKTQERIFVEQASEILKDILAKKGIIIRTEDLKEPLVEIGKLYHQMEKEDEL